jgi:hypothetical protein
MSNYKPRWLIQVDSVRGDMDSPKTDYDAYRDRGDTVDMVNQIDAYRNVYLVDRTEQESSSPTVRAYGQGYYGLPYKEGFNTGLVFRDDLAVDHYIDGVINRLGDEALDRLDALVDQKAREHEEKIKVRALMRGGEELLQELQREKYLRKLQEQRAADEARFAARVAEKKGKRR